MNASDFLIIYFIAISIISAIFAISDKISAKMGKCRVPEDFLMTLGLLGGALAEFIVMKIIRHKTRHKKFMIGLPIEIIFHIALIIMIVLNI